MKTYAVGHDQWEALNHKGERKAQTDFASTLQGATMHKLNTTEMQDAPLDPLSQDDFAGGNAALPPEAVQKLKALTGQDFGAKPRADLQPLASTDYVPGAQTAKDDTDSQVRKQTEKWVSETFYGAMLKQMHNSPFKSKLFDGGRGAEAFEPMLDQQISDHIAHGASNKLVDSVVNDIEAKMKKSQHQPAQKIDSQVPVNNNPYWNERAHVAPGIRA